MAALAELAKRNSAAELARAAFREGRAEREEGVIDARFHQHKNANPFFGFVEVEIAGTRFVMFSANDDLVAMSFFWHGAEAWEPASLQIWQDWARDADRVLDVGAFSGVYALAAAATAPGVEVLAVEAARRTWARLLLNVQANGFGKRVRTVNRAASDGPGSVVFNRFRGENILGIGDGFLPKDGLPALAAEEQVETVAVDALLASESFRPDAVKVDVEGAELLVLDGMAELLSRHRPRLLIEVTPDTAGPVIARLARHGYRSAEVDEGARRCRPTDGRIGKVGNLAAEFAGVPA
ncbi:MAG: FkbM family methyltransferase [Pseudomonadota bacterium]